ncbi:ATP-binding protein, partial [Mesorhizobium sp.]|uniref:ATP-binding protein n=1 Tax=Mesorhizobium sp. TaxID=1871066 RepID=UPI00338E18E2
DCNGPGDQGKVHHEAFANPVVATALLDRLLHHAVVIQIEGSSRSRPRARSIKSTYQPASAAEKTQGVKSDDQDAG